MPACSCVCSTTRVASASACPEGAAASQSGRGYEPTTVVFIRGGFIARNHNCRVVDSAANCPAHFADIAALEEFMTRPTRELEADLARAPGDILVLGVGGKMGPTLARMAKRAAPARRVVGVARFSEKGLREKLEGQG